MVDEDLIQEDTFGTEQKTSSWKWIGIIFLVLIICFAIFWFFLGSQVFGGSTPQEVIDLSKEIVTRTQEQMDETYEFALSRLNDDTYIESLMEKNNISRQKAVSGIQLSVDAAKFTKDDVDWIANKVLSNPEEINLEGIHVLSVVIASDAIALSSLSDMTRDPFYMTDFSSHANEYYNDALAAIDSFDRNYCITRLTELLSYQSKDDEIYKYLSSDISPESADLLKEYLDYKKQKMQELRSSRKYTQLFLVELSVIRPLATWNPSVEMRDSFVREIAFDLCKRATSICGEKLDLDPDFDCDFCEDNCEDPMSDSEIIEGATSLCKQGNVDQIPASLG